MEERIICGWIFLLGQGILIGYGILSGWSILIMPRILKDMRTVQGVYFNRSQNVNGVENFNRIQDGVEF